jgi:hypothetical protein
MGFLVLVKSDDVAQRLADYFQKIGVLAEVLLFVYIGAAVRIDELAGS